MSGIFIAAAITSAAALANAPIIARLAPREARGTLILAALVMLPMQPLAFYLVRIPLDGFLTATIGPGPLLTTISLFYAPLTEEPAKWLVLLLPAVRRALTREQAIAIALATGLGFGLGEIWFIAGRLARVPSVAVLPFWQFGGFFVERIIVCFLHGAFVAFAFLRLAEGRSFLPGALIGIVLHFALNLPILFIGIDLFGLGREVWGQIVFAWLLLVTGTLAVVLSRISGGELSRAAFGVATCPSCGTTYDRPWFAINLGWKRYERCPACRKWHVV
jgi:hypothetical protein